MTLAPGRVVRQSNYIVTHLLKNNITGLRRGEKACFSNFKKELTGISVTRKNRQMSIKVAENDRF